MDRYRFDNLTRAMAMGSNRRTMLKGLLGGAALGAGVTFVPRSAGAQDEICIESGGACEMVDGATPCCGSYTCFEAQCDNAKGFWAADDVCDAEYPCYDDSLTCIDGACVEPASSGGEVDALPAAGAGPTPDSTAWTSAVAAGGAAVAAALLLRRKPAVAREAAD